MSTHDPVASLLARLSRFSQTISQAYFEGRVHRSEENANHIEALKQMRMLSPDIRDAYQLRGSLRQFLKTALNSERLFATGADIGAHFGRLAKLIDEHSIAFQEGRDSDCERYEMETREAISDIADAIDDELSILHSLVATRFATVSTLAEKRRQNEHYLNRTEKLVQLLAELHFSDLDEMLQGHDDLMLSYRSLLQQRIPAFRDELGSILVILNSFKFEFRKIEEQTRRLRAFSLHLKRHPEWTPKAWDEAADPPAWLCQAKPLALHASPTISDTASEETLAEIARSIPATAGVRVKRRAGAANVSTNISAPNRLAMESPIRRAIRAYFREAAAADGGISARRWWGANPQLLAGIGEERWLLRVLAEHENKGRAGKWSLQLDSRRDPIFRGNLWIRDVLIARKGR